MLRSYALHVLDDSHLFSTLMGLSLVTAHLIVLSPHKKPAIGVQHGWTLVATQVRVLVGTLPVQSILVLPPVVLPRDGTSEMAACWFTCFRLWRRPRGRGGRQRMPEKWSSRVCVQMRYLACYYQGQSWIPVNRGDGYFLQ